MLPQYQAEFNNFRRNVEMLKANNGKAQALVQAFEPFR
jgi:hypothetical protein